METRRASLLSRLREVALVLGESPRDYDPLLQLAQGRDVVLLGEATHGTAEFYAMRAQISQRMISEAGFEAVAAEADWPDAYRLNRYVQGGDEATLDHAFDDFQRFPRWMWRNREVRSFIAWLRQHNLDHPQRRAGIYGLDLYSLHRSAEAVGSYLERVDPDQAAHARRLYAALDHVRDAQEYGLEASRGLRAPCRDAAIALLVDLTRKAGAYLAHDGPEARDEYFFAERNAHVVINAERYYRTLFGGRTNSWNLRDSHMVNTLLALRQHLRAQGGSGRIVVWAHNSHIGDARATEMGQRGEWNIGQLLREQMGAQRTLLVGFTTYTGHVTAARDWDGPAERRQVLPARRGSWEHLLHASGRDRFFLPIRADLVEPLSEPLLERAIGVLYRPETELASHYFRAALGAQFDALFHLDETSAVEPMDSSERREPHAAPETYPFGV
jgi:erythromycin esterase-like protein